MTTTSLEPSLSIGGVLSLTGASLRRTLPVLGPLALLLVALPEALFALLAQGTENAATSAGSIVSTLGGAILQGAVAYAVIADLNGRPTRFNEAFQKGASLFLPLWGLSIVIGFGLVIGFLLFIVPGLILTCMWAVASPARVAEGPGVFAAAGRSATLTKGFRWKIFGLYVVLGIAAVVLFGLAAALAVALGAIGDVVVMPLLIAGFGLVGAVVSAVLYTELRRIKEGAGADALTSVFD